MYKATNRVMLEEFERNRIRDPSAAPLYSKSYHPSKIRLPITDMIKMQSTMIRHMVHRAPLSSRLTERPFSSNTDRGIDGRINDHQIRC
jgi:hypothetical protein